MTVDHNLHKQCVWEDYEYFCEKLGITSVRVGASQGTAKDPLRQIAAILAVGSQMTTNLDYIDHTLADAN